MKMQRGAATLLLVMSLLALISLALLYTSRHVLIEHFNAQAQHKYHQALGYAEQGLEAARLRLAQAETTPPPANSHYQVRFDPLPAKRIRVNSRGSYDGYHVDVQQLFQLEAVTALTLPCGKHGGKTSRSPQHDPVLAITGKLDFFGTIHQAHGSAGAQPASCFPVGEDLDTGSSNPRPNDSMPDWGGALADKPPAVDVPNSSGQPLDCKALQQAIADARGGNKPWVIAGPVKLEGSCPINAKGQPQDIVIVGDVSMRGALSLMQANLLIIGDLIGRPMSALTIYGTANGFNFDQLETDANSQTAKAIPGSWIDSAGTP
ncbi:hypothetical protein [Craterilacuibacter sp. RT1T]|uniref:hypothetical protein n=1 Tax=Craterilacuibacter sp. RT1T TaxID=2942211 RepID=UPI0020BF8649|nr:hypothetical protein [Craterilacuibacter sp. RT1T]MCL6264280.1 hypothetical protein [Craterilacuibacter sp. RT1T]